MKADDLKGFFSQPAPYQGLSDQDVTGSLQTAATPEIENPGALAGATGAVSNDLRITRGAYHRDEMKATWSRLDPSQKRAVRMLALTLFLGRALDFDRLAVVLHARLTEQERVKLAWAALRSLDPEPREWVFELAHWGVAE